MVRMWLSSPNIAQSERTTTTITQSILGMSPPSAERQLADVGRAVRASIRAQHCAEQKDPSSVAALERLQYAVTEYSQEMRGLGHYPEKVLAALKSAVRDVGTPIGLKPTVDALVTDAAQWCITAYFDAPSVETVVEEQEMNVRSARNGRFATP